MNDGRGDVRARGWAHSGLVVRPGLSAHSHTAPTGKHLADSTVRGGLRCWPFRVLETFRKAGEEPSLSRGLGCVQVITVLVICPRNEQAAIRNEG